MSNYLADPAGRFSSDTHRRVLGHLSYPDDNYGWTVPALVNRMLPDVGTNILSADEMQSVLNDLEADGHAQRIKVDAGDVWRMTEAGLGVLTGPIANEPGPGARAQGPAQVGATPLELSVQSPTAPTDATGTGGPDAAPNAS